MPRKKKIQNIDRNLKRPTIDPSHAVRWLDAMDRRFTVRGLAWLGENKGSYSRLPLRAKALVREPVWHLSQSPASAHLAFRSDTTSLYVKVANEDSAVMSHMPGTGSNGLALYCGKPGRMRPWCTVIPDQERAEFEQPLFTDLPSRMREFRLYFPLYKAMTALQIGICKGARILRPSPPAIEKPVVFYGTSITQGGCASTSGTDFVSRVGRILNINVVNLGFSGNGKGEPELARLAAEIDASLFVLDYASNTSPAELRRTLPRFVRILRERRPHTPILLMTNLCYSSFDFNAGIRATLEERRDFTLGFYAQQRKAGNRNIHLADGFALLPFGVDSAYVDGAHPTSHGFHLIADRLAPCIEQILMRDN